MARRGAALPRRSGWDPSLDAKRISNITLLVGVAAVVGAVLQTVLAIALSTSAFLIAMTAIHVAAIVAIFAGLLVFLWVRAPDMA